MPLAMTIIGGMASIVLGIDSRNSLATPKPLLVLYNELLFLPYLPWLLMLPLGSWVCMDNTLTLTPSLIHTPTHTPTHTLTNSLTHSLTHTH